MASHIPLQYEWFLNRPIWPINGTLTDPTTQGQSEPGSNGNERVLHASYITWNGTTIYAIECLIWNTLSYIHRRVLFYSYIIIRKNKTDTKKDNSSKAIFNRHQLINQFIYFSNSTYPCPWGYYNYADAYFVSTWEDMALEVTVSAVKNTDVTCKTHSG